MKVVLFCGGMGTRIREYSDAIPKPMVPIGYRPMLWHVMKYYAHYGHKDFILCLGYKADVVKNYFLNYDECVSNNFVLSNGGRDLKLLSSDIQDWKITFVDTGINSNLGQRLKAAQPYLEGESMFLANYSDGLTDLPLDAYVDHFRERGKVGSFLAVTPQQSFHFVKVDGDVAYVGITDYAVSHLSDLVFLDLPDVGTDLMANEPFGEIESVKAVSDLFCPVTAEVLEQNEELLGDLSILGKDAFGAGWMLKVRLQKPNELNDLLDAAAYEKVIKAEESH